MKIYLIIGHDATETGQSTCAYQETIGAYLDPAMAHYKADGLGVASDSLRYSVEAVELDTFFLEQIGPSATALIQYLPKRIE
jgi:hypothetical protein